MIHTHWAKLVCIPRAKAEKEEEEERTKVQAKEYAFNVYTLV